LLKLERLKYPQADIETLTAAPGAAFKEVW